MVGDAVGDRVPPSMSLRTDTSRPVVTSSAKASTYSASANRFSSVHPACRYMAKTPDTKGAAMEVPDLVCTAPSLVMPADTMSRPGAHMSMQRPTLLEAARTSPSAMLPTAITPGTRAGVL